jgi:hypothetical protein
VSTERPVAEVLYEAIRYALNRAQTDPEFRWHMLHTETFERLCAAEAAFTGTPIEVVRDVRGRDLQPEYRKRVPECGVNRGLVRAFELELENLGVDTRAIRTREAGQ